MRLHQRTIIRLALCELLKKSEGLSDLVEQRVFPNRWDAWFSEELPAVGLYIKKEGPAGEAGEDKRSMALELEVIVHGGPDLDAMLDTIALHLEEAMDLDAIGAEITALGGQDTLQSWDYSGSELDMATDQFERDLGVLTVSFDLVYAMPTAPADLPDFVLARTGWNLVDGDPRVIHAEDKTPMNGWADKHPNPLEEESEDHNG